MKAHNKAILGLMIGVLLVTACGGALTPVPLTTPVATNTAIAQTALPVTSTPAPAGDLWDQLPPPLPVDHYELVPVRDQDPEILKDILQKTISKYYPYSKLPKAFEAAFETEAWSRADLDERKSHLCAMVYADPASELLPKLRPGQDLFSFSAEELFKAWGEKFERLPEGYQARNRRD